MMNHAQLVNIIREGKIEWSAHALRKMLERGISRTSVKTAICKGELIENYPDDKPFPSALFFAICENNPLHVIAAYDCVNQKVFVITAYWPDDEHFEADKKTRRK